MALSSCMVDMMGSRSQGLLLVYCWLSFIINLKKRFCKLLQLLVPFFVVVVVEVHRLPSFHQIFASNFKPLLDPYPRPSICIVVATHSSLAYPQAIRRHLPFHRPFHRHPFHQREHHLQHQRLPCLAFPFLLACHHPVKCLMVQFLWQRSIHRLL